MLVEISVKRFWLLMAIVIATSAMFTAEGLLRSGEPSQIWGMPVVAVGGEQPAWISFGGVGVIVLGAGFGVIAFTLYGVGLLFATGQLAAGLFAFGQLVAGLLCFVAQLGIGASGVGQLAVGGLVVGQAPIGFDGEEFLKRMNADINELLKLW